MTVSFDEPAHCLIKPIKPGWRCVAPKPIATTLKRPPSITESQTPWSPTDDATSVVARPFPGLKFIQGRPERFPFLRGGKQLVRWAPLYPTAIRKVNQPLILPANGKMRPTL